MTLVYNHPVTAALCAAGLALTVAVAALEWERVRAIRKPRVPLFMEPWL